MGVRFKSISKVVQRKVIVRLNQESGKRNFQILLTMQKMNNQKVQGNGARKIAKTKTSKDQSKK